MVCGWWQCWEHVGAGYLSGKSGGSCAGDAVQGGVLLQMVAYFARVVLVGYDHGGKNSRDQSVLGHAREYGLGAGVEVGTVGWRLGVDVGAFLSLSAAGDCVSFCLKWQVWI